MRDEPPATFPPAPPEPPDYEPALVLISSLSWRSARKTNRWGQLQTPHQYTMRKGGYGPNAVRDPADAEDEAIFAALFNFIQEHGRIELYGRTKRKYLYPGDGRKYWGMTPILSENGNINRMWIADDVERLRRTGQL